MVIMIETLRDQFNLLTEADKQTFVTAAMSNDPSQSQLVQDFMQLSKAKQHEFLLKALFDSAWRKSGAGVGDDAATKNKDSMKAGGGAIRGTEKKNTDAVEHEKNILRNAVKETFGVSDAALDKMTAIVEQVTDAKSAGDLTNNFVEGLKNLFARYGGFFLDDNEADLAERLCDQIQWLETEIAAAEAEADLLRMEIEAKLKANEEREVLQRRSKKPKRSFIEEDMLTPNEDNSIFLEDNNKRHSNRQMDAYLKRIDADVAYVKKS